VIVDNEFYVFSIGDREDLVDGDSSYTIGSGVPIVYKATGRLDSRASVTVATDPTVKGRPNPDPTLPV
jgi:hypothetical protein